MLDVFLFVWSFTAMSQAVQTNGTQPLSKTWELSLYELQRTPQVWQGCLLCLQLGYRGHGIVVNVIFLNLAQKWFNL